MFENQSRKITNYQEDIGSSIQIKNSLLCLVYYIATKFPTISITIGISNLYINGIAHSLETFYCARIKKSRYTNKIELVYLFEIVHDPQIIQYNNMSRVHAQYYYTLVSACVFVSTIYTQRNLFILIHTFAQAQYTHSVPRVLYRMGFHIETCEQINSILFFISFI